MNIISKKYFINDNKRNTFCMMLLIMLILLSVFSLAIDMYDYNLDIATSSNYFNVTIHDYEKDVLDNDYISIVSSREDTDSSFYIIRILPENEEKLINVLKEKQISYGTYDNSNNIAQFIKFRPLVIGAVIICLALIYIICVVIIMRKFKREETMRRNLNNIGANIISLLKLDSVYAWVFICYYLLISVLFTLILINWNDYLLSSAMYIFGSIALVHLVVLLTYFSLLYASIVKIKRKF